MPNKRKSGSNLSLHGLHYVLDLSLEESGERIRALADEARIFERSLDEDSVEMRLEGRYYPGGGLAKVWIALRRWQGTQTRFDAQTQPFNRYPDLTKGNLLSVLAFIATVYLFPGPLWWLATPIAVAITMIRHSFAIPQRMEDRRVSNLLMTMVEEQIAEAIIETLWFGTGFRAGRHIESPFEAEVEYQKSGPDEGPDPCVLINYSSRPSA